MGVDIGMIDGPPADRCTVLLPGYLCISGGDSVFTFEVVDCFFKHTGETVLFVVSRHNN